jgi:hypothetical protein
MVSAESETAMLEHDLMRSRMEGKAETVGGGDGTLDDAKASIGQELISLSGVSCTETYLMKTWLSGALGSDVVSFGEPLRVCLEIVEHPVSRKIECGRLGEVWDARRYARHRGRKSRSTDCTGR